jgi:hypothetical protein
MGKASAVSRGKAFQIKPPQQAVICCRARPENTKEAWVAFPTLERLSHQVICSAELETPVSSTTEARPVAPRTGRVFQSNEDAKTHSDGDCAPSV